MWIVYVSGALLLLAIGGFGYWALRLARTPPFLDGEGNPLPNSIASLEEHEIGGVDQWLAIRGRDRSKPVLLFLHGGPGTPETPWLHHFNRDLEDHFVVVAWEQRGAGKSYSKGIPPDSMTVEQFIEDSHELTQMLKARFDVDKIYLTGHSWGAHLGLLVAQRYPGDYHAYVGISQPVNFAKSEAISYQWALDTAIKANHRKAIRELQEIGPPENGKYREGFAAVGKQRKWVRAFGGALYGKNAMPILIGIVLRSPVYTLKDTLRYFRAEQFTLAYLGKAMETADLSGLTRFELPVYFVHGKHDYQAVYSVTEDWFETVQAPRKRLVPLEKAAHGALFEQPETFLALMRDMLAETHGPAGSAEFLPEKRADAEQSIQARPSLVSQTRA